MLAFEAAWTKALIEAGMVTAADGAAALDAIDAYGFSDLGPNSDGDGLPVPGFVAALKHGLPSGVAAAIHNGGDEPRCDRYGDGVDLSCSGERLTHAHASGRFSSR